MSHYENNSLTQLMGTTLDKYLKKHEKAAYLPVTKEKGESSGDTPAHCFSTTERPFAKRKEILQQEFKSLPTPSVPYL